MTSCTTVSCQERLCSMEVRDKVTIWSVVKWLRKGGHGIGEVCMLTNYWIVCENGTWGKKSWPIVSCLDIVPKEPQDYSITSYRDEIWKAKPQKTISGRACCSVGTDGAVGIIRNYILGFPHCCKLYFQTITWMRPWNHFPKLRHL
jgi:hypothetical protein